jgi:DNA-binding transcriptional regulator YiaG
MKRRPASPAAGDPEPRQLRVREAKRRAGRPTAADPRVREAELFGETRRALELDPEVLAAILGTHLRTIFRWERNERSIPPHLWLTLAQMLIEAGEGRRAQDLPLPAVARAWLRGGAQAAAIAVSLSARDRAASPVGEQ